MKTITSKDLKKAIMNATGLKAREISVREDRCTYDWAFNVELKKEYPLSKVEEVTEKYTRVDRCEASGEILSGGNVYIRVSYQYDMILTPETKEKLTKIIQSAEEEIQAANIDLIGRGLGELTHQDKITVRKRHFKKNVFDGYTETDFVYLMGLYNN